MTWADGQIAELKRLWAEGLSCSKIAAQLGNGTTRNAVIGKVHRLNLSGRALPTRPRPPETPEQKLCRNTRRRELRAAKGLGITLAAIPKGNASFRPRVLNASPAPSVPRRAVTEPPPSASRVTILHLSDKTCRWPIGDPGHKDFCFCGHGPKPSSPYCEYHHRLGYDGFSWRERRNAPIVTSEPFDAP